MSFTGLKLTNFYDLNECEKLLVLEWRNTKSIRKWMYNSNVISVEEHYKFIENLKDDESRRYFLVSENEKNIGVIYFMNQFDISAEFGLYANPDLKGMGKIMMESIYNYWMDNLKNKRLVAEVFVDNYKAIKLYKTFDLKLLYTREKGNNEVMYLEWKK